MTAPREPSPWRERPTAADVDRAIAAIASREPARAADAQHVYDTLTWGEGPGVLSLAGVQNWLWHQLPTKYLTDEVGYKERLAGAAAELFDEVGLPRYADVCRSEKTRKVHRAFDRSRGDGYAAMRRAADTSGVLPSDVAGFSWGSVMGSEESGAFSASEAALEAAIDDGTMRAGARGWRAVQETVVTATLDADHPTLPGQSWRTAILTERASNWSDRLSRRAPAIAPMVDRVLRRVLVVQPPPADAITAALHPWTWLGRSSSPSAGCLSPLGVAFAESFLHAAATAPMSHP